MLSLLSMVVRGYARSRSKSGESVSSHIPAVNLIVELKNDRSAIGRSVCLTYAADAAPPAPMAEPFLIADYIDEYSCDEHGVWQIARRHIERVFVGASNTGPPA